MASNCSCSLNAEFAWLCAATVLCSATVTTGQELELLVSDDFRGGMEAWQATDADFEPSVWKIGCDNVADAEPNNPFLRVTGKSRYTPPFRSPHSIAWL